MAEYTPSMSGEASAHNLLNGSVLEALFRLDQNTPRDERINFKPLYFGLFNGITQIIDNVTTIDQAIAALKYLQCAAEDAYINQGE